MKKLHLELGEFDFIAELAMTTSNHCQKQNILRLFHFLVQFH